MQRTHYATMSALSLALFALVGTGSAQAMPSPYGPEHHAADLRAEAETGTIRLAANTATTRNAVRAVNKSGAGTAKPVSQPGAGNPSANDWSAGTGSNGQWVIRDGRGPEHEIDMPDEKTAKRTARKLNKEEDKGEKRTDDKNGVRDDGSGPCGPNSNVQC